MQIPLTNLGFPVIDKDDLYLIQDYKWFLWIVPNRNLKYARATSGYQPLMHQLIMGKPPDGLVIDHIDGDGLNNRRRNLRFTTNGENISRGNPGKNNRLGVKGVYRVNGKYRAEVVRNKKKYHIGYFVSISQASAARDAFIRKLKIDEQS